VDEVIARNFIIEEKPEVVVDIVDASNLERNLYLSLQLLEMDANLVIALNMMDVARSRGYQIDAKKLSGLLGVTVVPLVAARNQRTRDLLITIATASRQTHPPRQPFNYDSQVEDEIARLEKLVAASAAPDYPARWLAVKLLEEDEVITRRFKETAGGDEVLRARDESLSSLKKACGSAAGIVIADARYAFIGKLLEEVLQKPEKEKVSLSDRIDSVVLNTWLGIPIFAAVLFGLFQLIFSLSLPLLDWINGLFDSLGELAAGVSPDWLGSLLADGVIGGVGTVVSFVPVIFYCTWGWLSWNTAATSPAPPSSWTD
jgi:ferrous iron transport protein B